MENTERNEAEQKKKKAQRLFHVEILFYFVLTLTVLVVIPKYVAERIVVDGTSMENTLFHEESVLTEKISPRIGRIHRFDIVVFYPNGNTEEDYYIKRIIGLPGETVQILDGRIYIDGELLDEHYGKKDTMSNAGRAAEKILLGDDEYFVLGDNREISKDSRSFAVGNVKAKDIAGKVMIRIWPLSKLGKLS